MRANDILSALVIGKRWTKQVKAEERSFNARVYRESMWTAARVSLKDICWEHMPEAWEKASGGYPASWRQVFYVMRQIVDEHPDADRPLRDKTFKAILEEYLAEEAPDWDVLKGARGSFIEPHTNVEVPMSTMNVRHYLQLPQPDPKLAALDHRYPTTGATNRFAAVLICEKDGFDEILQAADLPAKFDLGLMYTKGVSVFAARDLADSFEVPCFVLHDMDKNGFVMAAGFPGAVDIGLRMEDVEPWGLASEEQRHRNKEKAYDNLISNGATREEADFIAYEGRRVELNMLTSDQFIEFVEGRLRKHGVEKVISDAETLSLAWGRAQTVRHVNRVIEAAQDDGSEPSSEGTEPTQFLQEPDDLAERIRHQLSDEPTQTWDDALWKILEEAA